MTQYTILNIIYLLIFNSCILVYNAVLIRSKCGLRNVMLVKHLVLVNPNKSQRYGVCMEYG